MCKRIFKFELHWSSYWQNIKFSGYCPKFHILIKIVIFEVYFQFFRPTPSTLKILWRGHVRNTLFHFCQNLRAVKLNSAYGLSQKKKNQNKTKTKNKKQNKTKQNKTKNKKQTKNKTKQIGPLCDFQILLLEVPWYVSMEMPDGNAESKSHYHS